MIRDFLIIGDLNSYAMEDPIDAIKAGADDTAGHAPTTTPTSSRSAWARTPTRTSSTARPATSTTRSPARASTGQVTGVAEWHINADEPDVVDYDTTFKGPAQDALYEPNGFRSSDHDPILVGLDLKVTYDDLCRLTKRLVTKAGVASALCDKLEAAEAAAAAGDTRGRDGALRAYRNQLSAQSGKSVTPADAAHLAALSRTLVS